MEHKHKIWTGTVLLIIGLMILFLSTSSVFTGNAANKATTASNSINSGSIVVSSTPTGANVYVDNTLKGKTPTIGTLTIKNIKAGNHIIKIQLTGYQDYSKIVTIKTGKTETIKASLIKQNPPTPIEVKKLVVTTTPTGAKIYIDNIYKGTTPISISNMESLRDGIHEFKVEKSNYLINTTSLYLKNGKICGGIDYNPANICANLNSYNVKLYTDTRKGIIDITFNNDTILYDYDNVFLDGVYIRSLNPNDIIINNFYTRRYKIYASPGRHEVTIRGYNATGIWIGTKQVEVLPAQTTSVNINSYNILDTLILQITNVADGVLYLDGKPYINLNRWNYTTRGMDIYLLRGTHTIKVTRAGFVDYERIINTNTEGDIFTIPDWPDYLSKTVNVKYTMLIDPNQAVPLCRLSINSNPRANMYINGNVIRGGGGTSFIIENIPYVPIPILRMDAYGYKEYFEELNNIIIGADNYKNIQLTPNTAPDNFDLALKTNPGEGVTVKLDGNIIGTTSENGLMIPIQNPLMSRAYILNFQKTGYESGSSIIYLDYNTTHGPGWNIGLKWNGSNLIYRTDFCYNLDPRNNLTRTC